ncbi:potassium channel family protein [Salimicrobium flavidum]|uniref:Potassium channel LctB n=1 Tax=Salimicrobium flavidum TaxID=570947 RepID=A0A1N7J797_9BACI|nr:potassium channel family protein [Salimicrobium flavidum]SIS45190.1 potassium channel LctB [Salimicrobium flavidum]
MTTFLIIITLGFIAGNTIYFFRQDVDEKGTFDPRFFLKLLLSMTGVLFGFAFLYYFLNTQGTILVYTLSGMKDVTPTFLDLLYFSGETLISVGYGDMVPVGPTRFFAILEAMIGVLMPTAFFVKTVTNREKKENEK